MSKEKYETKFRMRLQLFGNEDIDSGIDDNTDVEATDDNLEDGNEINSVDDTDESVEDSEVVDPNEQKQSKDQDRAFADLRRRAEQAERELQTRDKWVNQMFAQYGVQNWQDYQAKMEQQVKAQREQQLKDAGVDPRVIEQIIKNDPELVQLKQQNQILQEQMKEQAESTRMVSEFNELVKEFGKDFPELSDPNKIPSEVWDKYNKGYSMVDAFYVTQRGKIMENQAAKTKQSTLNKINSKQHLKTEGAGESEGDDISVPKDVLEMYLDSGFSKKEAMSHYKKLYKK